MKSELQNISLHIFHLCLSYNILLEVEWIPRDENFDADFLSKMFDFDDWGISHNIFIFFNKLWGPFTCDTFADNKNKKVSIFFSRFFTPGTSGVDAFAYDRLKYNNWIVPPVHLISRTIISHMRMCKARGTLVIPKWKSAVFWPMIKNRFTDNYQSYIKDLREYKKKQDRNEKRIFALSVTLPFKPHR